MRLLGYLMLLAGLTACAKAPYTLALTDMQGVSKGLFQEGEAIDLKIGWDLSRDEGKTFDCSFADSFNGEPLWRGTAIAPKALPGQQLAQIGWVPPYPVSGITPRGGDYVANCNFGNETMLSATASVRRPFAFSVIDMVGNPKTYFGNEEPFKLYVVWDLKYDAGKLIDCRIVNTQNGASIWQGTAVTPGGAPNQIDAVLEWTPPFPESGIRLKRGNYSATCRFNNEMTMAAPISVTNVKSWP